MDVTSLARGVVRVVRIAGPITIALALALLAASLLVRSGRARVALALAGLVGASRESALRRFASIVLLPTMAVTVLTVSLAMEQEVREGPNRVVNEMARAGQVAGGQAWVLQTGTHHLMNNSRLDRADALVRSSDPLLVPVWAQLADLATADGNGKTALIIAPGGAAPIDLVPEVDRGSARCVVEARGCRLRPGQAITDPDVADVGSMISVRCRPLRIVAHARRPLSLLNRAVVVTEPTVFANAAGALPPPYAITVLGPAAVPRAAKIAASLPDAEVADSGQLRAANSTFWAGSGTPIVVILIAMSAIFSGFAGYASRRAAQEHARVGIGTLRAIGLTPGQVTAVDAARGLVAISVATLLAAPATFAMIHLADATILVFHASFGPGMLAASAGLLTLADLVASALLWRRLRATSIVEAISGV
jgi:hypothetical protein